MKTVLSLTSLEQVLRLANLQNKTNLTVNQVTVGTPTAIVDPKYNSRVTFTPLPNRKWKGPVVLTYNRLPISGFSRYGDPSFVVDDNATINDVVTAFNTKYKSALAVGSDIDVTSSLPTIDYLNKSYTLTTKTTSLAYIGNIPINVRRQQGALLNGTAANGVSSPQAVQNHCGAVIGNELIIMGGNTGLININTVRAYNLTTKVWSTKATGPSARAGANAVALNGILYVCCGVGLRDLWAYNPVTNVWTQKASLPAGKTRDLSAMTALNGKLYIHGGATLLGTLSDLFVYNPSTDSWTELASSPSGRQMHALVGMSDRLFLFGGGRALLGLVTPDPEVQCFNTITGQWSIVAPNPDPQAYLAAVEVNGFIYCYGGGTTPVSKLQCYDPVKDTWTNFGNIGSVRSRHVMGRNGNKLIVHGGTSGSLQSSTIELL